MLMKFIIGLIINIFSVVLVSTAFADVKVRELVHYRFGNQITNSEISILSNGLILVRNRAQATMEYLPNLKLKPPQASKLLKNIEVAMTEESIYREGAESTFGSSSGDLAIFSESGRFAFVFQLGRGEESNHKNDQISEKIGPASKQIKDLIQSIAKDKMPLL